MLKEVDGPSMSMDIYMLQHCLYLAAREKWGYDFSEVSAAYSGSALRSSVKIAKE